MGFGGGKGWVAAWRIWGGLRVVLDGWVVELCCW